MAKAASLEARVSTLEREIRRWIDEVWTFSWRSDEMWPVGAPKDPGDPRHPRHDATRESVRRLLRRWSPEELGGLAADMYCNPGTWWGRRNAENWRDWDRKDNIVWLLRGVLDAHPPADLLPRLEARIAHLLGRLPHGYEPPDLLECVEWVLRLPDSPETLDLVRRIVLGDLEVDRGSYGSYEDHGPSLSGALPRLLERLHRHGEFTFEVFERLIRRVPRTLSAAAVGFRGAYGPRGELDPSFVAACRSHCARLVDRVLETLRPDDTAALETLAQISEFHGPRYLLEAARLHRDFGMGVIEHVGLTYKPEIAHVLNDLAGAFDAEPASEEKRDKLVERLRTFPRDTLRRLVPLADHGRSPLLEALGWRRAIPLAREIERLGEAFEDRDRVTGLSGSPDLTLGALDLLSVRAALEQAGADLARELFGLFRDAKRYPSARMLLEAVPGWNREEVLKRALRRTQPAMKALGLLPVEKGEGEVLERYVFLKRFARESKKFGPMRHVNEQAASQVGLTNLAQVTGYGDATRLEWAMEARIGGEGEGPARLWKVGAYAISIEGLGDDARIVVLKEGKRLSSVPPPVRKDPAYAEAKEALVAVRGQVSRFRATFEDMMANEDRLAREDVSRLLRLPVGRDLLSRLLLSADGREPGLLDPDRMEFVSLDGSRVPVPDAVTIAHPYHLLRAGLLAGWQRELVRRRVVQPFKQVFREVYVLTPAERTTRTYSNRFAGRLVNPRIAQRLFQGRGWRMEAGDLVVPYRLFPKHGLRAEFILPDAGHYLGETKTATSDQVYFLRTRPAAGMDAHQGEARVPLDEVPPLPFSEVMRDADLIVSVAPGTEEEGGRVDLSEEAYQRRGEIVTTILWDLGLSNVLIEGRFARIEGKRAKYRIHLGSANVYIEPANHVCIVPDRYRKPPPKMFLPFLDEDDPKISEVVSKVVLLANDDRIKDEDILRQIREGGHPADTAEILT